MPKNEPNKVPPTPSISPDIFSFKKHSMDYFTVNGVILRTGYADKKYWYTLCIKEFLDNGVDFVWKYYQGYSDTRITVYVTKEDSVLHIKIRNSNTRDVPAFQNLELIFDTEMRYGSKQNENIISRGMLGDAMKQILALAYVLIHSKDDGTAFTNEQWNKPLIIRCNGKETHVRVIVDKSKQTANLDIKEVQLVGHTDTEIEVFLPLLEDLDINELEKFCRTYPLLTTDVSFKFRLVDNSTDKPSEEEPQEAAIDSPTARKKLQERLVQVLSSPARKAAIKIEYPALHPISTNWNNVSSMHSLLPDEFVTSVTSVYDQESTALYDVLHKSREGSNMKKTDENQISIAQFLSNSDYPKKLEEFYHGLKGTLGPPKELSLPYTNNKERKTALISRVCNLYPNLLAADKAFYKVFRGFYDDKKSKKIWSKAESWGKLVDSYTIKHGDGILQYPFAIEVLAIPYKTTILNDEDKASEFIGSINYSLSPRSNEFDGDYEWYDKHGYPMSSTSMKHILKDLGFHFYDYSDSKAKIPSIIIVNIVSPRVDYHGYDKSRIDTHAFSETIIEAAKKISDTIQTFRAAGFVFHKERQHDKIPENKAKVTPESLVEVLLRKRMQNG
jgi:hypothetical protein